MIPTTDASKPKPSATSLLSLPPPYTYEDLYSSYQKEWDQQLLKKNDASTKYHAVDIDIDIDENVSDLKWVTLPSSDGGDINKSDNTYLLACTGSGEVLAWKLTQSNENRTINHLNGTNNAHENRDNTGPKVLLEQHARLKIGCHNNGASEADDDSVNERYHGKSSLHAMRIVVAAAATNNGGDSPPRTGKHRGRKRQRPMDGNGNKEEPQQQQLLIVAGEGGLWSIPLLDLLQQSWKPSSILPSPSSLLQLSDRPIRKLQESPPSSTPRESEGCLFALEEDTNTLAMWKLSTILEKHTTNNETSHTAPYRYRTIDLSRCFSGASAGGKASKSKTRRTLHNGSIGNSSSSSSNERATTILIVPALTTDGNDSITSSSSEYSMLVGTDQSRLWSIPIPSSKDDETTQKPRFFSLEASETKEPNSRQGGSHRSSAASTSTCPIWRVTDILETNGSTWWTVSATTKGHVNADTNTGLLMTWHAPTGMVVTRQETREAIQAMLQHQNQTSTLYTAANEGAVTAWESPFRLVRRGRFWASPRSGKALASCQPQYNGDDVEYTVLAVAGVGNKVDLFLNDCRIQTVRI